MSEQDQYSNSTPPSFIYKYISIYVIKTALVTEQKKHMVFTCCGTYGIGSMPGGVGTA